MAKKRREKQPTGQRRHNPSPEPLSAASHAESRRRSGVSSKSEQRSNDNGFPVVGLGASAGGLEAVRKLLGTMPANTGIAFILIQHLDPKHESMMVDLLARDTAMKVLQAAEGMPIDRNCLYIIPPQAYLSIRDGVLRLSQPQPRAGARMPFDFFLGSLAEQYGERAICVILSGTGTDGSVGLKAISEKGGLVIAQDPEEAAYDGMPRNAIATGAVNLVLPAAKIPPAVMRYARHPYVTAGQTTAASEEEDANSLAAIINLLLTRTSHDFSHYKRATLLRRVRRRMAAAGIKEFNDYIKMLRKDSGEVELLAKDLFIHVTSFFRDPDAYEALARTVVPELVRQHAADGPIRAWVPGCSTGEEAYSLAMLFFEELAAVRRTLKLQIFASDVSADAVNYGRNGTYPDSIKADVSAERLARFFTPEQHGYRVSRDLRDSIVFTVQDLLIDPPFSHLDLISCRNLLIYLQPSEQEKVLALFHYALREGGYLVLGTSETIGKLSDRFEPVSDPLRIFRRIGAVRPRERSVAPIIIERSRTLWPRATGQIEPKRPNLGDLVQKSLLDAFAPATVLVNERYQGLYFVGPVDRYLLVAPGEPSRDLPTMLRSGLASKFRAVVRQASKDHTTATIHGAEVKRNGDVVRVALSARSVQHEGEQLLLVSFTDEPGLIIPTIESPVEVPRVEQLEQELESTRKELEATIRDLQATNQELTSLNEEAVSMNEEFQSTNEELESSREELQSLNEELTTVNSQLQEALTREHKISDDLQNILNSSAIATLFLDRDLNIRVFTPAAAPMFNLIPTDIGRPLGDLANRFAGLDLLADARTVLLSLAPIKRDVRIESGTWHLCSISPYRAQNDRIDGVIINLTDISDLKATEEELRYARGYAEAIINTIRRPLIVIDEELKVVSASRAFYSYFRCTPGDTLGRPLPDTDAHHLDIPDVRALLDRLRRGDRHIEGQEITLDLEMLGQRTLLVTAEELQDSGITDRQILISFDDISDFKRTEQQLDAAKRAAELANLSKSRFLAAASHDLRQPLQTLKLLQGALGQQVKDGEALRLLERSERAIETMGGTLATLLDINQLETGIIRPTFADFPVDHIFDALKTELTEQAHRRGLSFRVVPCRLSVRSDWRLLEEMVRNLLSNAFRYTDRGKILLGARRRRDTVMVEVWDTGLGIHEDEIPRIFEDYYQVDDGRQRGGLGLGLAIVQRLGELLGHAVSVRSRPGKGSVFSIGIPRARPALGLMPRSQETTGIRKVGVPGSILVIEDEVPVRELLELTLKKEGHRVISVASGEAALTLVGRDAMRPDLVLTDYNLAGTMSGVEAAVALRAALDSRVPVIVLTGDIRKSVLDEIAEYDYVSIQKPVDAAPLLGWVQNLLVASRQASTFRSHPQDRTGAETASTIFVVDDDRDAREAMQILLSAAGYEVKTFATARMFLDSHRPGDKGCLITDVRMPGMGGFELLARLAAAGSHLPAIVITGRGDIAMAVEAMKAGAADFVEKPADPDTLLSCVARALKQAASPTERSAWHTAAAMRIAGLTARERQVMDLVVAGHPNKEIAVRLDISQRTVETHRAAVMEKTGASSIADLVRLEMGARGGDA